jgi:hypothetical protein
MTDRPLHAKYIVKRRDRAELVIGSKHYGGCDMFVLDLDHDPAALIALMAYADAIESSKPGLAASIRSKYGTP